MGWKRWPSWVKGGLIGLFIGLVFLILLFYLDILNPIGKHYLTVSQSSENYNNCVIQKEKEIQNLTPRPAISIFDCMSDADKEIWNKGRSIARFRETLSLPFIFYGGVAYILWFGPFIILGLLIGWIIGKVKSRKQGKI